MRTHAHWVLIALLLVVLALSTVACGGSQPGGGGTPGPTPTVGSGY